MPAAARSAQPVQRLLIVMPTWLGDCVMATPTLRALRGLYPEAQVTALAPGSVEPILAGGPWADRLMSAGPGEGTPRLARRLRAERFDMAVLLPNSFRSALLAAMAQIPRRVGYDRDGRSLLLTDRLLPRRRPDGKFVPVPTRDYYLGLARYLGAIHPDPTMELFTRPEDDRAADELLARGGHDVHSGRQLVLINPGANYGDAKMWYPDRFAAVADRCVREWGASVAVSGAPKERAILDKVLAAAKEPMIDLPRLGLTLAMLKSVIRRSSVVITNDTGPRHVAAAMGTPVVTIFGPTDPAWTVINFDRERQVSVPVDCGPCQLKICPLDHRCMTRISPAMVFEKAAEVVTPRMAPRTSPTPQHKEPA